MSSIYYKTIFLIFSIFPAINTLDIKLSLGKKLASSGHYPLVVTLTEPFIYETNPIDLFCVFDVSGSMSLEKRLEKLKASLNLIIDALDSNDRLSLIKFESKAVTIAELAFMSEAEKRNYKAKVNALYASGGTDFQKAIREFINGIDKTHSPANGRVQSIIFLTDGEGGNAKKLFETEIESKMDKNFDFTVHTFGIGKDNSFDSFCALSDYRDGSFYYIKNLDKLNEYVLNTIGGLRTTAFKHVEIAIDSYYPIVKVFESNRLNLNPPFKKNTKHLSIEILQFITGTEYTYVLELDIDNNIKVGDNVVEAHAKYQDFEGYTYNVYNYINFYYAVGCFNCYREEYCRCSAIEVLEDAYSKGKADSSLIEKVRFNCGDYMNQNISDALIEIQKDYSKSYILGLISEAAFKKGGMHLWYSNEYQFELISEFVYNKSRRYIWEKFHVPYWKLRFLRRVHRALAVPLEFIYILIAITISIPLCFISFFGFRGTGRLIFNMVAGLIIQIALFDVAFLNVFISCCVVYILLRFTSIHGGPILFALYGYLIMVHIFHFVLYGQTLDFGASPFLFMFAIAKITFFTYAVRERNVNPASFINQYHRYCITGEKFPNFLEFLSYIYFFPSAIYGPCFQIKDYLNYIYSREEYKRIKYRKELIEATIRIIVGYGLIFLYYFFKYNSFLQLGIFKTYEYIASDDALSVNVGLRFLMIYGWCIFIKFYIYGFFQLIYGIFMTTGIAYSEEVILTNFKGGDDYVLDVSDKKGHCGRILKSDLGYNIGEAINHFNRSIHIYLKYCVYIRIIFLRHSWIRNYFIAAVFVFIFAALWCGIYFGAYFFFAAACIIYQCHFNLELMGFYDWLDKANIGIKIIFTILVQYIMSMVFCMLFLYKLDMILCYLRNFYYIPAALVTLLYIVSLLLRIFVFKKNIPPIETRGRSKTKKQISRREALLQT